MYGENSTPLGADVDRPLVRRACAARPASTTSAGGRRLPLYHVSVTVSAVYFVPGKMYSTCTSSDQL